MKIYFLFPNLSPIVSYNPFVGFPMQSGRPSWGEGSFLARQPKISVNTCTCLWSTLSISFFPLWRGPFFLLVAFWVPYTYLWHFEMWEITKDLKMFKDSYSGLLVLEDDSSNAIVEIKQMVLFIMRVVKLSFTNFFPFCLSFIEILSLAVASFLLRPYISSNMDLWRISLFCACMCACAFVRV